MQKARIVRILTVGTIGMALVGLFGTSAGAATGAVPKSVVEAQAAKVLAAETGEELPSVKCPGDLKGKVGASIQCVLTPHGSTLKYPVVVTVGSVHNGTAHFHVQVGQAIGAADMKRFCADSAI